MTEDDASFARRLVVEGGVAAVPVSAFYETRSVTSVLRFCFAKAPTTLDAALDRLGAFLAREGLAGAAVAREDRGRRALV
jgi:aspartate/methionine/tyrosine aminotransferase